MQSGEEVKLAFKITGVPTLPAGDGLDEAGWAPFNPKWRLVIYNEEGGEVRILSGQAASLGVNQIPLEVTWDGKDSQGNPAEAGNYTYKLFCLEQSDGLGYGVAQGNLTVGEPVLELYDEDDNLIASSIDPIVAIPTNYSIYYPIYYNHWGDVYDIFDAQFYNFFELQNNPEGQKSLTRIHSIFQRKHNDTTTIKVKLKNVSSSEPQIKVKLDKSQPEPQEVILTKNNGDNFYSGILTLGPTSNQFPIKKFINSYTAIDNFVSNDYGGIYDSNLFLTSHPPDNGTDIGYKQLGFAHNEYRLLEENQVIVSIGAIKAAGYENLTASYKINDEKTLVAKLHISNQASEFFYDGHGKSYPSDCSTISVYNLTSDPFGGQLGLRSQYFTCSLDDQQSNLKTEWLDNLDIVMLHCCEVLDIGNYNCRRVYQGAEGYPHDSPGLPWIQKVKPGCILLGYNSETGSLSTYYVIRDYFQYLNDYKNNGIPLEITAAIGIEHINQDLQNHPAVLAWLMANAYSQSHYDDNACAITNGSPPYYYFIRYDVNRVTLPNATINQNVRRIVRLRGDHWPFPPNHLYSQKWLEQILDLPDRTLSNSL